MVAEGRIGTYNKLLFSCFTILQRSSLFSFAQNLPLMHLLSIFALAIIATGGATAVAEGPLITLQDTTSDLLTLSSGKQAGNGEDGAAMMTDSDSDSVVDAVCSPSLDQPRRRGKMRRGDICSPVGRSGASPPKGQQGANEEQTIVPYRMAPAEETPSDSSAASDDGSDDPKTICNPLVVGMNRQVAVCDAGRALNRILNVNIRMPTVWPVATTYTGGSYTVEDVAFCKSHFIIACGFGHALTVKRRDPPGLSRIFDHVVLH